MKAPMSHTDHDQNWHWPEKTWFRERLNAMKAQEHEQRRKAVASVKKPEQDASSASSGGNEVKVD